MKIKTKIMILVLCMLLVGCSKEKEEKKEYYENTVIEKFETFTSLTGIELASTQKTENEILYNYILDDNANGVGAISKWEQYIEEYGFIYMSNLSKDNMSVYTKGEYIIVMNLSTPTDSTIQYIIAIPIKNVTEAYSESNVSDSFGNQYEDYKKMVELTTNGKYQSAKEFYNNSSLSQKFEGYSDSKKYYFYAMAMLEYEAKMYVDAYEMLEKHCKGFLNADEILSEIDSKIGCLDGVYMNQSVSYDGMYVIIDHGSVAMGIYSSEDLAEGVYYIFELRGYTFTTGKETLAVDNYIFSTISDNGDSFLIAAEYGSQYKTFSGVYKRIDIPTPPRK